MKKIKKIKKIIGISGAILLCMTPIIANAEFQVANPTHEGATVACTLSVTWAQPGALDVASASTRFNQSNHYVGTRLYSKTMNGSYVCKDAKTDPIYASVRAEQRDVYTYLTEHYVYHYNNGSLVDGYQITSLIDW